MTQNKPIEEILDNSNVCYQKLNHICPVCKGKGGDCSACNGEGLLDADDVVDPKSGRVFEVNGMTWKEKEGCLCL